MLLRAVSYSGKLIRLAEGRTGWTIEDFDCMNLLETGEAIDVVRARHLNSIRQDATVVRRWMPHVVVESILVLAAFRRVRGRSGNSFHGEFASWSSDDRLAFFMIGMRY
jgi:hypothetical protein